ncbi:MAG: hypothetical protein AABX38_03560 [Candidatus Micrarchaeota archaeon]
MIINQSTTDRKKMRLPKEALATFEKGLLQKGFRKEETSEGIILINSNKLNGFGSAKIILDVYIEGKSAQEDITEITAELSLTVPFSFAKWHLVYNYVRAFAQYEHTHEYAEDAGNGIYSAKLQIEQPHISANGMTVLSEMYVRRMLNYLCTEAVVEGRIIADLEGSVLHVLGMLAIDEPSQFGSPTSDITSMLRETIRLHAPTNLGIAQLIQIIEKE